MSTTNKKKALLYISLLDDEEFEAENETLIAYNLFFSKRSHRFWMREHIKYHSTQGEFSTFFQTCDDETFNLSYRVSRKTFHELHSLLEPYLRKTDSNWRKSIKSEERLAICLKYLATGCKYSTLGENFRIGKSSVSKIVREVCDCLWNILQPIYMPVPTRNDWYRIANEFEQLWQFKNCVGAIDGKHVYIKAPNNTGSSFFNYKHRFSIVLMCVSDARRKIIMADIGSNGSCSDGGIFADSEFGRRLQNNALDLPPPVPLTQEGEPVPFVFIGDEAFPLSYNLLRPYPRSSLNASKRIFNYRLSRARRIVEATFGVLKRKWYVYHKDFECQVDTVDKVVKATCVLHNYLIEKEPSYLEETNSNEPSCQEELFNGNSLMLTNNTGTDEIYRIRDRFCDFFNNQGQVPWQHTRILRRLNINV